MLLIMKLGSFQRTEWIEFAQWNLCIVSDIPNFHICAAEICKKWLVRAWSIVPWPRMQSKHNSFGLFTRVKALDWTLRLGQCVAQLYYNYSCSLCAHVFLWYSHSSVHEVETTLYDMFDPDDKVLLECIAFQCCASKLMKTEKQIEE